MIIKKDYIIYRNLTKVVDLILKNEKIESIEPSALNGLYQIKSIILEFNFIKQIEAATFRGFLQSKILICYFILILLF
jgi:hypothetical protein